MKLSGKSFKDPTNINDLEIIPIARVTFTQNSTAGTKDIFYSPIIALFLSNNDDKKVMPLYSFPAGF